MTRLVHLTDLHFGLHHAPMIAPLRAAVLESRPDVVVVSGDLTHRARSAQFAQAMALLRGLEVPVVTVPGNHDVPLWNLLARMLTPFSAYRAGTADDAVTLWQVGRLRLFAVNTADPWQWRGGCLRDAEVDRIVLEMRDSAEDAVNILVAHHPFEEPPGFDRGETRGARAAMDRLRTAGLRVILSGHLHHWSIGLGIAPEHPRAVFQMQTGTALCRREGERDHGFAVMDFAGPTLLVRPCLWDAGAGRFGFRPTMTFAWREGAWHAAG